jgi:WD40 repeat protein
MNRVATTSLQPQRCGVQGKGIAMGSILLLVYVFSGALIGSESATWNYTVLCVSDDLRYMVVAPGLPVKGQPQSMLVWDIVSEKIVVEIPGRDRDIGMHAYKLFGNGRLLLSDGKTLVTYDVQKARVVWQTTIDAWVATAAVSPDNKVIAVSKMSEKHEKLLPYEGSIEFFREKGDAYERYNTLSHRICDCLSMKFDDRGKSLFAMEIGGYLLSLNPGTAMPNWACRLDGNALLGCDLVSDDVVVLSNGGGSKGECLIVDSKKGSQTALSGHQVPTDCVCTSVENGVIATADGKGTVCVWSIDSLRPLWWFRETENAKEGSVKMFFGKGGSNKSLIVARSYGARDYAYEYSIISTWDIACRKLTSRVKVGRMLEKRDLTAEQGEGKGSGFSAVVGDKVDIVRYPAHE